MKIIKNDFLYDIAIIGGGASGLMTAAFASNSGVKTVVFEKNPSEKKLMKDEYYDNAYLGKKLLITGKGRCNLTNDCSVEEFLKNVPVNSKFLYSALRSFTPQNTKEFFENNGCKLKTERGNRVFPESDNSRDVLEALKNSINRDNCTFLASKVIEIVRKNDSFTVKTQNGEYIFKKVIICTGGLSYPVTGSTGDGYEFAKSLGHTVTDIRPSLVPLELKGDTHLKMQGLSLRNVVLNLYENNKKKYSEIGEMLFTHFGVSGPLVLSASAHMQKELPTYRMEIDLKPALTEEMLDARLISDFKKYVNRDIDNAVCDLLPQKMISPFIDLCQLPHDLKVNSLKKEDRRAILNNLKHFPLEIKAMRPIKEAIITSGGIPVKEINPSTMESKICEGLYFAGEIIDVDAYTGGFNLQIAFSTGRLAGLSAAGSLEKIND